MKKSTEELSLLTEQEIVSIALNYSLPYSTESFARAIESAVIKKIKAQGAVGWCLSLKFGCIDTRGAQVHHPAYA